MLLSRTYPWQLFILIFADALGNLTHFLLQLQKLLICHVVRVDINATLIMHAHHHVFQVFHVHDAIFLISILRKNCTSTVTLRIFGSEYVKCIASVTIS